MRSETEREKSSSDVFMPDSSVPMIFCESYLALNLNANDFTVSSTPHHQSPKLFKLEVSLHALNVLRSFFRSKH